MTREKLADLGFTGFLTFRELHEVRLARVPTQAGVYAVLREADEPPRFLEENPGGRFKGRDPTVAIATLEAKWVVGSHVLYLGKADDLQRRLRQFVQFGWGKPVGHWGGRYIWQVEGARNFVVAWKAAALGEAATLLETHLLERFRERHGVLPFANLR